MFKSLRIASLIKYGIAAAILFCIPMVIFIRDSTFTQTWLLYVGNLLFMISIAAFLLIFNKKKNENASTTSSLITGQVVTVIGVVSAAILSFIALVVFIPRLFQSGAPHRLLQQAPAENQGSKTNGLVLMVLMNAIIGNVITGSFVSIVLAYYQKKDQTKEGIPLTEGRKCNIWFSVIKWQ